MGTSRARCRVLGAGRGLPVGGMGWHPLRSCFAPPSSNFEISILAWDAARIMKERGSTKRCTQFVLGALVGTTATFRTREFEHVSVDKDVISWEKLPYHDQIERLTATT